MGRSKRKTRNVPLVQKKKKDPNQRRLNPRKVQDPSMRKAWDVKKTVKQNIESMSVKELFMDRLPKEIPKEAKHQPKVNEEEAPICERLFKKHGDNYDKMHMDIKINIFQWTAQQCRKRVMAWKDGKTRSAAAEILSGHGVDIRKPIFGAAKARNVFGH
mmetsp:Transcript_107723/g.303475  ORF Transcript_107723/g.303475 Transcript_107723/m.303475 type:complete len:159 (-) Transcript_107723:108-584(-)|eukprot:CAMPEP_0117554342 /NCGR_PEP_ID=MMETSP0784-20121206/50705_1 /TAXON_ID=39447 /ORGANISM="" /LENGTH=158 /DNA_ID=CAMNT_0005351505 /DNA_START=63 /DNA_END=539 /DNA_ORIENTATION=+